MGTPPSAQLAGKRVLVTGGNKGLGLEIASELHRQGSDVTVVGRKSSAQLDALPDIKVITGIDVQNDAHVASMVSQLEGAEPFDIVINNAGYFWEEEVARKPAPASPPPHTHQVPAAVGVRADHGRCDPSLHRPYLPSKRGHRRRGHGRGQRQPVRRPGEA